MPVVTRNWVWAVLCLAAAAWGFSGCASAPVTPEVETVGALSASYHSITVAPVHHDAPPELGKVVETGSDDIGDVVSTTTRVPDVGDDAELPEVAPKSDGVKLGEVRQ